MLPGVDCLTFLATVCIGKNMEFVSEVRASCNPSDRPLRWWWQGEVDILVIFKVLLFFFSR
jgi:hypothetical protein